VKKQREKQKSTIIAVMTGSEKILLVARLINERFDSLITGTSVELNSGELERMKINQDEQVQIFDFLSSKNSCIQYASKLDYESEDDLEPETRRDIFEISSMNGVSEDIIKQDILNQRTFTITVLPEFKNTLTSLSSSSVAISTSPLSKNPMAKLSLNKRSDSIELTIDGITKPLTKFRGRKFDNYIAFHNLYLNQGLPLTWTALGINKHKNTLRHLPKTMGIDNEIIKIFFVHDPQKNTLQLNPLKVLTDDEAATVRAYVNNKNV